VLNEPAKMKGALTLVNEKDKQCKHITEVALPKLLTVTNPCLMVK